MVLSSIKHWLSHPSTRHLDLDDPRTTELRREVIQTKRFLHDIYSDWYQQIARSVPEGDGEVLATFAGLMGVAESDRAAFDAFTQQNFARIFASEETTELDVIASLDRLLVEEPALEAYAHRQG